MRRPLNSSPAAWAEPKDSDWPDPYLWETRNWRLVGTIALSKGNNFSGPAVSRKPPPNSAT